jgi:hypothetical protein
MKREKYICYVSISSESDLHRDRRNVRRQRRPLEKIPLYAQAFLKGVPKLINSRGKKKQKKEECS